MRVKKAQEEMVGFVLIMVVVAVIFLVLLSLFIMGRNKTYASEEVSQFVDSVMNVHTACSFTEYKYEKVSDLLEECSRRRTCNEGPSCDILEETLKDAIEESWTFYPDGVYKGYELTAFYEERDGTEVEYEFNPIEGGTLEDDGTCKGVRRGYETPLSGYRLSLEICFEN